MRALTAVISLAMTLLLMPLAQASMSEWFKFEVDEEHLKIPVTLEGVDGYAIIDMGSPLDIINKSFLDKHNLALKDGQRTNVSGVLGIQNEFVHTDIQVEVFGEPRMFDLVELELAEADYAMVLGARFFEKFIVQFDYPNKQMRLIAPNSLDMGKIANVEMKREDFISMPLIRVNLNKEQGVWLLVDPGNVDGLLVEEGIAKRNDWISATTNTAGLSTFPLTTLVLGPYELSDVNGVVAPERRKMEAGDPYERAGSQMIGLRYERVGSRLKGRPIAGLLGYDVLQHFIFTIDHRRGLGHIYAPE